MRKTSYFAVSKKPSKSGLLQEPPVSMNTSPRMCTRKKHEGYKRIVMGFSELELKKYQTLMDDYIESIRPPAEIRDKVDLSYRIEHQSIHIFEIRPLFQDLQQKVEIGIAKTTYVRSKNKWKIFWMRSDLKWHGYEPDLFVDSLDEVLEIVKQDEYACFWG